MLKLTKTQLSKAMCAVGAVESYEAAKDRCGDLKIRLDCGDWRGNYIEVSAPKEPVLKELNARIRAAHEVLAALGIEFVPGGEEVSDG